MKIVQISNEWRNPPRKEYADTMTDIEEAAQKYGQANDTVELYDDAGTLKAIAIWPQGSRAYKYCTCPHDNPADNIYRY